MIRLFDVEDVDEQFLLDLKEEGVCGQDEEYADPGIDPILWQNLCDDLWDDCKYTLAKILSKYAFIPVDIDKWSHYEYKDLLEQINKVDDLFWDYGEIMSVEVDGKKLIVGQIAGNAMFRTYEEFYVVDRGGRLFCFLDLLDDIDDGFYQSSLYEGSDSDSNLQNNIKEAKKEMKILTGDEQVLLRDLNGCINDETAYKIILKAVEKNALDIEKLI